MRAAHVLALAALTSVTMLCARDAPPGAFAYQLLPKIAPAPEFALISQDGKRLSLGDLRGKVVAITFIYTLCNSTCPVLTPLMSLVQDLLGPDFGKKVAFVSITIDPEHDTPEMLKLYAQMYGANLTGWYFLTGPPAAIRDVTRRYGVFASYNADGGVDHTFLTSIVDQRGVLRVQYLGVRFNPDEFRSDILALLREP